MKLFLILFGWLPFVKRWQVSRDLLSRANEAEVRDIEGLGKVTVYPLNPAQRFAMVDFIGNDADNYVLYCWVIVNCVQEFSGYSGAKLGMTIKKQSIIIALAEAVFDVSGMTKASQEKIKKNSTSIPSGDSSSTLSE